MEINKIIKLINCVQGKDLTYSGLIKFVFGETPPEDNNFLKLAELDDKTKIVRSDGYKNTKNEFTDNENRNAVVGFLITDPFTYYIYKNIYRHLPESEFILDAAWIRRNIEDWENRLRSLIDFLLKEEVKFRLHRPGIDEKKFFKKYEVFVYNTTTYYLLYDFLPPKKVRVMYGHSKDSYNFGPWSHYYDLALTYGQYSHNLMSLFTKSEIVGNPKFDDWFSGKISEKEVESLKKHLNPNKKTVLYLPTHGNLCSLEFVSKQINHLIKKYNLIIRPHQRTIYSEAKRLEDFKNSISEISNKNILWSDDYTDIVNLLYVSDLVISDNSGAIFDAVLADKPLVLIDFLKKDYFEKEMWKIFPTSVESWTLPMTYPDSIEQRIKREKDLQPGEINTGTVPLLNSVAKTFELEKSFSKTRKKIREMLFSYCDGKSGKRAARAIRELIKSMPRKKSFMDYAIQENLIGQTANKLEDIKLLRKILAEYCAIPNYEMGSLESTNFSIIIPTFNGSDRIKATLDSLIKQKGIKPNRYEIIVVDDGSILKSEEIVKEYIKTNSDIKISYIHYPKNRGPAFAKNIGINFAGGEFICFTDDDCIVPENWLVQIKEAFKKNPEVSGIGGWYAPLIKNSESAGIFDRFVYWYHVPEILFKHKSQSRYHNKVGNTGNVCYRKSAIKTIGGFNHYFRYPSLEDWELKIRMHKNKFSLLFLPEIEAIHQKRLTISEFLYHFAVRGWASFLLYKIHPELELFNFNIYNASVFSFYELPTWISKKKLSTEKHLKNLPFSYTFVPLNFLRNICLWIGKYWITYNMLRNSNKIRQDLNLSKEPVPKTGS